MIEWKASFLRWFCFKDLLARSYRHILVLNVFLAVTMLESLPPLLNSRPSPQQSSARYELWAKHVTRSFPTSFPEVVRSRYFNPKSSSFSPNKTHPILIRHKVRSMLCHMGKDHVNCFRLSAHFTPMKYLIALVSHSCLSM